MAIKGLPKEFQEQYDKLRLPYDPDLPKGLIDAANEALDREFEDALQALRAALDDDEKEVKESEDLHDNE